MPRAMDWLHYRHPHCFRMVGREGSITEAGRRLGLVQTTVPGLAQTTVTGQVQTRVAGLVQPTVTGLAQTRVTGLVQTTVTGLVQTTVTGLAQTTVAGQVQPTVTGLVRALEAALGEKLFTRTGRSVVMTEVGGWWRPGARSGEAGRACAGWRSGRQSG